MQPLEGYQYGVMFKDGSVMRRWNGNTQEKLARDSVEKYQAEYPNDNIKLVRRRVGPWEDA